MFRSSASAYKELKFYFFKIGVYLKNHDFQIESDLIDIFLKGDMAEWLGRGLQNLVRRFESACRLR